MQPTAKEGKVSSFLPKFNLVFKTSVSLSLFQEQKFQASSNLDCSFFIFLSNKKVKACFISFSQA